MKSPREITENTETFAKSIVADGELFFIQSKPLKGEQLLECYDTVENYVATHGGERILGWCFFDWPRVLLMAELHAVWKRPDGSFLDIAPHQAKQTKILFLPDPFAVVPRVQEPNRYYPVNDDPAIQAYIDLEDEVYQLSDPESRFLVMTPKIAEAQTRLVSSKVALAKKYGWPPGTSISERAGSSSCR